MVCGSKTRNDTEQNFTCGVKEKKALGLGMGRAALGISVRKGAAQAAEVVAVLKVLQAEDQEATLAVFTDSDGVCGAVVV